MEKINKAIEKLNEAKKGEGAFSRDQLQHAENTIEAMKSFNQRSN